MNILFISTNDWVPWGGSEVLWSKTALTLTKSEDIGIGVSVRNWNPAPQHILELIDAGAEIFYRVENTSKFRWLYNKIAPDFLKLNIPESTDVFQKRNWQLVIFSLGDHNEGADFIAHCRMRCIPYCIIVQLAKKAIVPASDIEYDKIKSNYIDAHKVYFVSEQNKKIIEVQLATFLTNGEVISNPFPNQGSKHIVFKNEHNYNLAFVASLFCNHKGHDILFEVLANKKWKERNLVVNLYGKGPHEKFLKSLKQYYNLANVNFAGFTNSIDELWSLNHGLILCSRMEGQSLALLEAMSYNRMAIVTDVGDASVLIDHKVNGFIAEAPTVKHIDEALEEAWEMRDQWENMGILAGEKLRSIKPADPVKELADKILQIVKPSLVA